MNSLADSILFNTDSYKPSMFLQYPPNTTGVYSYIESRGGRFNKTVVFGLQGFIKKYLTKPITQAEIDAADEIWTAHGEPFNRAGWEYILKKHKGFLPLVIKAVPEGSIVPTGNVLVTVENTDPNVPWLTTWVETPLLRAIWYPTTVATQSRNIKEIILDYLKKSGDESTIDFKLHDFGSRGVSSLESASIGGAAHLVNFKGSDTMAGILYAKEFYNAGIAGFSIPASEHSTITSWGKENEVEAYRNMLKQFARPGSLVAVVSDSYDIYNAAENLWGGELRQEVIDSGATVIIRPDSGDPLEVNVRLIKILAEKFGYTINDKGFKVLKHVRIIQGDGVNEATIKAILGNYYLHGWSADNIAFGMGGALLQQLDRDTQKFAMKCSSAKINGKWVNVQKDPVTDSGKRSKAGRVTLYKDANGFRSGVEDWEPSALVEVFRDGVMYNEISFEEVRQNSNK
jgi:nicotinamide phosphoribosyltransferase